MKMKDSNYINSDKVLDMDWGKKELNVKQTNKTIQIPNDAFQ